MANSRKRRKFFDESGLDSEGVSAKEFVRRARRRGFLVDPRTGDVTVGQGSVLADDFRALVERRRQQQDPLTARGKAARAERRKLLWHIYDSGRTYVKQEKDGGTSLYWDGGRDFRGRRMRHPLRLATSARSGLTVDDFVPDSNSKFGFTAPEMKEGVMADQFARFYEVLTGRKSVTEPTDFEREAGDYYAKVSEAGSVMSEEQQREVDDGRSVQ